MPTGDLNHPLAVVAILAAFAVMLRETFFFARSFKKNGHSRAEERVVTSLEAINTNLTLLNDRLARHLDYDEKVHENIAEIRAQIVNGRLWR